jgi:hypothetical protein
MNLKKLNLVLLPLDDRPVNYDYPHYLARLAGCTLHVPPREWLGNPWRQSQYGRLVDWLVKQAQTADLLVIAIDTVAYGGLIPSRTSPDPLDVVFERLSVLRQIKTDRPELPVLASSVIQRVSRSNSSEEEKDYWATYGSAMFRLSYLEHKTALGEVDAAEIAESARLRAGIPDEVYTDYRQGRSRNHAVNQGMLDWVADGVLDYLILPQDDTADYGWNIAEARALQGRVRSLGIGDRAITYPGADEIGCLLLASAVCRQSGFKPRVWPRYSSVLSPGVVTAYEDRPIHELVKAHLAPLGGSLASSAEEADLQLFINAPTQSQGEGLYEWVAWRGVEILKSETTSPLIVEMLAHANEDHLFQVTRREMESPHRSPEEFVRAIWSEMAAGHPVALADVAFVNGSDLILGDLLVQNPAVAGLCAYGGWNTAGNTLGTVLAQAVLCVLAQRGGSQPDQMQAHLEFLFMRLLDDYAYQARERTLAMLEDLPVHGLPPTFERIPEPAFMEIEASIARRLQRSAADLEQVFIRSGKASQVQVSDIYLPWKRLFEVGFKVKVTL